MSFKGFEGYRNNDPSFATRAIHDGQEPEQWESMAVVPPISLSTTFKQDGPAQFRVFLFFIESLSVRVLRLVFRRPLSTGEVAILPGTLLRKCWPLWRVLNTVIESFWRLNGSSWIFSNVL